MVAARPVGKTTDVDRRRHTSRRLTRGQPRLTATHPPLPLRLCAAVGRPLLVNSDRLLALCAVQCLPSTTTTSSIGSSSSAPTASTLSHPVIPLRVCSTAKLERCQPSRKDAMVLLYARSGLEVFISHPKTSVGGYTTKIAT